MWKPNYCHRGMGCTTQLLEFLRNDSVSHRKLMSPREKWQVHLVIIFNSAGPSELCVPVSIEKKIHLQHCNTLTCAASKQSALYNSHQNIIYPSACFSSYTNAIILMKQSLHPLASKTLSCGVQTKKVSQLVNSVCSYHS